MDLFRLPASPFPGILVAILSSLAPAARPVAGVLTAQRVNDTNDDDTADDAYDAKTQKDARMTPMTAMTPMTPNSQQVGRLMSAALPAETPREHAPSLSACWTHPLVTG